MKKEFLNRYARTESGTIIIDVAAARVADLYEDIDKVSPFLKKDLNHRLAEYLKDAAHEIGRESFIIRITLNEIPAEDLKNSIRNSVANFFDYMIEVERRAMKRMAKTSLSLFAAGIIFLMASVYLSDWMMNGSRVLMQVFVEGITVAGWVFLWNAITIFLIDWAPRRDDIRRYRRLSGAPIEFSKSL